VEKILNFKVLPPLLAQIGSIYTGWDDNNLVLIIRCYMTLKVKAFIRQGKYKELARAPQLFRFE